MKNIKLNVNKNRLHNNLNLCALVDDADYDTVSKYFWQVKIHGATYYAKRAIFINGLKTSQSMHRLILNVSDPKLKVDHIDHNGLNNQRNNLRICSQLNNSKNRIKSRFDKRNLTSIYKGVSWDYNKYIARIRINGVLIRIGRFENEVDAAIAYNQAALKYFGEYANLNALPVHQKITI